MSEDVFPHPSGADIGIPALRAAIDRMQHARASGIGEGDWSIAAAINEALMWIAALDAYIASSDDSYYARRNTDREGQATAGLVYARNLFAHGLRTATEVAYTAGSVRALGGAQSQQSDTQPGSWISMQFRWVPLTRLPEPGQTEKQGRDEMYASAVGGQPLSRPLEAAHRFLSREATRI